MTYSIIARDPDTGEMGVATASQAFAVGSSVPWALPGHGVIATQSMGEPMYGELGLDALRAGLTAREALRALRSVDPHPERRQVAMVDGYGGFDVYTGDACIEAAGHRRGEECVALANMVVGSSVWEAMVDAYTDTRRSGAALGSRLVAALRAAERAGGDLRGRRSAAITVVRATRTGRPWRDHLVDLRVDDDGDAIEVLATMVERTDAYHRTVAALELALDGDVDEAIQRIDEVALPDSLADDADLAMWRAIVLALADREAASSALLRRLQATHPAFVEVARRFGSTGLVPPQVLDRVVPDEGASGHGDRDPAGPSGSAVQSSGDR